MQIAADACMRAAHQTTDRLDQRLRAPCRSCQTAALLRAVTYIAAPPRISNMETDFGINRETNLATDTAIVCFVSVFSNTNRNA